MVSGYTCYYGSCWYQPAVRVCVQVGTSCGHPNSRRFHRMLRFIIISTEWFTFKYQHVHDQYPVEHTNLSSSLHEFICIIPHDCYQSISYGTYPDSSVSSHHMGWRAFIPRASSPCGADSHWDAQATDDPFLRVEVGGWPTSLSNEAVKVKMSTISAYRSAGHMVI